MWNVDLVLIISAFQQSLSLTEQEALYMKTVTFSRKAMVRNSPSFKELRRPMY